MCLKTTSFICSIFFPYSGFYTVTCDPPLLFNPECFLPFALVTSILWPICVAYVLYDINLVTELLDHIYNRSHKMFLFQVLSLLCMQ